MMVVKWLGASLSHSDLEIQAVAYWNAYQKKKLQENIFVLKTPWILTAT